MKKNIILLLILSLITLTSCAVQKGTNLNYSNVEYISDITINDSSFELFKTTVTDMKSMKIKKINDGNSYNLSNTNCTIYFNSQEDGNNILIGFKIEDIQNLNNFKIKNITKDSKFKEVNSSIGLPDHSWTANETKTYYWTIVGKEGISYELYIDYKDDLLTNLFIFAKDYKTEDISNIQSTYEGLREKYEDINNVESYNDGNKEYNLKSEESSPNKVIFDDLVITIGETTIEDIKKNENFEVKNSSLRFYSNSIYKNDVLISDLALENGKICEMNVYIDKSVSIKAFGINFDQPKVGKDNIKTILGSPSRYGESIDYKDGTSYLAKTWNINNYHFSIAWENGEIPLMFSITESYY